MNEHPPATQPENLHELPVKDKVEKIADIDSVINERIDSFNQEKEIEQKKIEIQESIESTKNRTIDNLPEKNKAVFTAQTAEQTKGSSKLAKALRRFGVAAAITLGVASHAKGQSAGSTHSDKEGIKKEAAISSKSFELDQSTKDAWDAYRVWYWQYVKDHKVDESFLQTTAGANQMIAEYKNETGNTITPETVKKVQHFFNGYKEFMLQAKHEGKVHINADDAAFMPSISKEDGIAGIHTMSLETPKDSETTKYRYQMPLNLNNNHSELIVSENSKTEELGNVNTSKYDDHSLK